MRPSEIRTAVVQLWEVREGNEEARRRVDNGYPSLSKGRVVWDGARRVVNTLSWADIWRLMWTSNRLDREGRYHPPGKHFFAGYPDGWTGPRTAGWQDEIPSEDEEEEEEMTLMLKSDFVRGAYLNGDRWALYQLAMRTRVEDGEGGYRTIADPYELYRIVTKLTRSWILARVALRERAVLDVGVWWETTGEAVQAGVRRVQEYAMQRQRLGIRDVYSVNLEVIRERVQPGVNIWARCEAEWVLGMSR